MSPLLGSFKSNAAMIKPTKVKKLLSLVMKVYLKPVSVCHYNVEVVITTKLNLK